MALYIARHGQTDWNLARRYQARTDVPINSTGQAQAEALSTLFNEHAVRFSRAVCSPLARAVETAALALAGSGLTAVSEAALLEIDLGEWEGRYGDDLEREFGEGYTRWREDCYPTAAPGGESMADLMQRVQPVVESLVNDAAVNDILVVAHQATNIAIKAVASGDSRVERMRWYRQSNDEVDIWLPQERRFGERLYATVAQ